MRNEKSFLFCYQRRLAVTFSLFKVTNVSAHIELSSDCVSFVI